MPQATDIVVKNGTNVDKTFTLIAPAAGYGAAAQWSLKEGTISAVFPTLRATATTDTSKNGLHLNFYVPASYTDSVTGLTVVKNRAEVNIKVAIPKDFPENRKDDWVAFVSNIVNHSLIKAMVRDATPAT